MAVNAVPAGAGAGRESGPGRRQLFALAAVLAAAVLTAAAAIAGLTRTPAPTPAGGVPAVTQTVVQQPPPPVFEEERGG
jgi:hypothetical protein